MKYKEIVYMIMDSLKLNSDDSEFNEEHILSLMDEFRVLLLKQRYADIRKEIPYQNYQNITVSISMLPDTTGTIVKDSNGFYNAVSDIILPDIVMLGVPRVYSQVSSPNTNYYNENIIYTYRDRMKFVGYQKYMPNFIYTSLRPDKKLAITTKGNLLYDSTTSTQLIPKLTITAIFQSSIEANDFKYLETSDIDILDKEFPLEESLINPLIEYVVKAFSGYIYLPKDTNNNAIDDLNKVNLKPQQQQSNDNRGN